MALPALLLVAILGILFCRSFFPPEVPASNDGPLGSMEAQQNRLPGIISGLWQDLNWVGAPSPSPSPTVSSGLRLVTNPLGFSKWFYPFSLLAFGLCGWFCFRQWMLSPLACAVGGLAAALSSHFFSTACWGVASQVICAGMMFVAVGLVGGVAAAPLHSMLPSSKQAFAPWAKLILAGMAVGMGVMEGYDIGAIFSLYVAAFVLYQTWLTREASTVARLFRGVTHVAVVALLAGFLAAHAILVLVGTQIKGVAGTEQTPEAKAARWDFATQWSIPKDEVPRILIPGLFGYRMDTPKNMCALPSWFDGGVYWGKVGETPGWSENHNDPNWVATHGNTPRFSGGGEYAGVLVVAVALWAVLQSLRKKDSVFSLAQRKFIWFWAGAAFISLLFAFGRYAPFYRLVYMLPYFSTIRNPAKFMHPFHWSLVILFAYGVHGLCRRYLGGVGFLSFGAQAAAGGRTIQEASSAQSSPPKDEKGKKPERRVPLSPGERAGVRENPVGLRAHLKNWWVRADAFEKKWTRGSVFAIAASLLAWLIYASSKAGLEQHLRDVGFPDPTLAARIAAFSIREVGFYIVFLVLSLGLLALIFSGWFAGRRARWGGILLGTLLVVDLSRANLPWIIYWDYKYKYATNPVIEFLREKPHEHRVAVLPFRPPQQLSLLNDVYRIEWAQHHFQFYNIQSLDIVQMPRMTRDYMAYEGALEFDGNSNKVQRLTRRWQLTNTRYLLGPAAYLDVLNQQIDPGRHRFEIAQRFDLVPKPGETEIQSFEQLTAVSSTNGAYAIFSFSGALPRSKLYSRWQVNTNDQATLEQLTSPSFDPEKTVLVSSPLSSHSSPLSETNALAGMVEFIGYAPKRIVLQAKAISPAVLLLNDKYDANWKVMLDGKPETLLRCNYIMRGVQVPAGEHRIEFRFEPPITGLYVTLAAIALGLGLIGFLALTARSANQGAASTPGLRPE